MAAFTGFQMVAGTTIKQDESDPYSKKKEVEPMPLAILTFIFTVTGFGASFGKSRKETHIPSIIGIITLILLLFLMSEIETDATNQSRGVIRVEYAMGFWMVLISILGAIVLNGYLYFDSKKPSLLDTANE